ncbi:Putative SOS response-associated peptidase YedK [Dyadobacter koreensis]|uniref:Abasic site processing protein n=1 Tax=Dyadobacter koreensis TaxID=408657 RepID=A0A1H7B2V2_9BACT|nr:SOS response-associated peptidase family protein [Dyadobacter koreensis]SEJ68722.1 Putative SOS response-associated peptidase YedK [Dyadobacter koreensis]
MCYHTKLTADVGQIELALKAQFIERDTFTPKQEFNGFQNPFYPVVRWDERQIIQYYEWGLLADYLTYKGFGKTTKDAIKARNNCLNARVEELTEKVSFKTKINNRCLIPMDGMYEWQWADVNNPKCKKTKYLVTKPDDSVFCCAGLFNEWKDPLTGFTTYCYTICTTEGNELMKQIKNEGERMLIVLSPEEHEAWLNPKVSVMEFTDRSHIELKAVPTEPIQATLF